MSLALVPALLPGQPIDFNPDQNHFCRRVAAITGGCKDCQGVEASLCQRRDHKLVLQRNDCLGGMIRLAVPVVVEGLHVATILSGKVRVNPQSAGQFKRLSSHLQARGVKGELRQLRLAWLRAPLLKHDELEAAARWLELLAQFFPQTINVSLGLRCSTDPPRVGEAKQFARLHLGESFTTRQVSQALRLSEAYFCRMFRRVVGTTFRDYVAGERVEAAKAALVNTPQSVTEIAMAAGFQSVSDFNRVFKGKVSLTPSQFRKQPPSQVSATSSLRT